MKVIWLDSKLVFKNFGTSLKDGRLQRRLRGLTQRSTAGVRWKRKWAGAPELIRNELTADATISLIPVKGQPQMWYVDVQAQYMDQVVEWLRFTCGDLVPKAAKRVNNSDRSVQRTSVAKWGRMPLRIDNG